MRFYDSLDQYASRTALLTENSEEITYRSLLAIGDSIARIIPKRSLVFCLCQNSLESIAGYLGFLRANSVPALLNATIDPLLLNKLLEIYRPSYIFLPLGESGRLVKGPLVHQFSDYGLFKTGFSDDYEIHEDLALLLTTSGSTGSAKFVRLSAKNIEENAKAIAEYLQIAETDRPATLLPMSYSYGLSILHSHWLRGTSVFLTQGSLIERDLWQKMKAARVTTFGGVPYVYEILKKLRFENMDLPSLQYITQAGGKLRPELCAEFNEVCDRKRMKFIVMYGQTEATARMSYLPWENARAKVGSIGIAIPRASFWLDDGTGRKIQENDREGELVYQGDNVSLGYAESWTDLAKGDENKGVLYTGDMAKRDADGFFYIVGRKKRFLKMFGLRVNLNEIEQILHSAGYDCACTGTDDNLRIYLTQPEAKTNLKAYLTKVTGLHTSAFKLLDIEKIPRNDAGKILYANLE